MGARCYLTLICTTHIGMCVSIVKTHQTTHGGGNVTIFGFNNGNLKSNSTSLIQMSCGC
jgi:hypothetical protein